MLEDFIKDLAIFIRKDIKVKRLAGCKYPFSLVA